MLRKVLDLIENAERVTSVYGEWPSFHDAEVLRLVLDRSGVDGPTLEAQLHVFQMTSDVDADGHYILKNHTLITMRFTRVLLRRFAGFNQQNVLWGLELVQIDPGQNEGRRIAVKMPSSFGMEAEFECELCQVTDVRPYDTTA